MSIKEEIEWFRPKERLPIENSSVLFFHEWGGLLSGYFKTFEGNDIRTFHSPQGSFYQNQIQHWAYLPKGPE